jgi:hypothetical protein
MSPRVNVSADEILRSQNFGNYNEKYLHRQYPQDVYDRLTDSCLSKIIELLLIFMPSSYLVIIDCPELVYPSSCASAKVKALIINFGFSILGSRLLADMEWVNPQKRDPKRPSIVTKRRDASPL